MIIDNQQEIIDAIYQNDSICEIYFGSDLVFIKRKEEEEQPVFDPDKLYIKGKFTDDSTKEDWYIINGTDTLKIDISNSVNPETKEFDAVIPNLMLGRTFYKNLKIERIDLITLPQNLQLDPLESLFSDCDNLLSVNLKYLNTHNYNNIQYLFSNCKKLENVIFGTFNTENITNMQGIFYKCKSLKQLDISSFKTGNVENIDMIFDECSNLETIHLGNNFDLSKVKDFTMPFLSCDKLKNITGKISNLGLGWGYLTTVLMLDLAPLTNESVMVFINGLAEVNSSKKILLKQETYSTLTDEQKQIAVDKGWTIAST